MLIVLASEPVRRYEGDDHIARNKYPEKTVKRILNVSKKLFIEKGYENTTIQDIVNELGDLSKGAIYHHFKSKEDIIEAVGGMVHQDVDFSTMFDHVKGMTGREKIKQMALFCVKSAEQRKLMKAAPTIMNNPKFLAMNVREAVEEVAPILLPYIEEGNRDGSLNVKYPKEAAEAFMLLINIWVNPLVFKCSEEAFVRKMQCLKVILDGMGLTVIDNEILKEVKGLRRAVYH